MKIIYLVLAVLISSQLAAQEEFKFDVHIMNEGIDAPVEVSLNEMNYNSDKGIPALYQINSDGEIPVPCQIENRNTPTLWFILSGVSKANSIRKYVLKYEADKSVQPQPVKLDKRHHDLRLIKNDKPVLAYRFDDLYPPEGINPLYKRSGFIHPLTSPGGEVLTRVQPPDHYHHYGIWGPWTLTHIKEREVDFWNLAKGQGTVRFAAFLSETEGEVFSGFEALQQHVDFGANGEDQIAINELLDVKTWNTGNNEYIIDYTTSMNTPLTGGIMLDAYRYGGGIGFRATERWHKDNCTVLTSEGKTRLDADGSNARWCIVEGESDTESGRSGILFLSHPSNRMHPEPMRVWPLDANGGRGDLFFEFCPIRQESWKLSHGKNYSLKYRMVVFDGKMDVQKAERYWNAFAQLPRIEIKY